MPKFFERFCDNEIFFRVLEGREFLNEMSVNYWNIQIANAFVSFLKFLGVFFEFISSLNFLLPVHCILLNYSEQAYNFDAEVITDSGHPRT